MGGAIYNAGRNILNINDSTFENNSSTSSAQSASRKTGGGAIHNDTNAVATVVDSSFKNNTAKGTCNVGSNITAQGGAILNNAGSTLNLIAQNKDVVFEGNKAGADEQSLVSNGIYDYGGTINLNAAEDKSIVFNDSVASADSKTVININKAGEWENRETAAPTGENKIPIEAPVTGTIVLNNNMDDYKGEVNLHGGTLALGEKGTFFNNASSFNVMAPSTFNAANGVIQNHHFGNFNLNSNLNMALDADLAQNTIDTVTYDTFNATGDSKINIEKINVITDAAQEQASVSLESYDGLMDVITLDESAKTALGKIYKYDVSYDDTENELVFNRSGSSQGGGGTSSSGGVAFKDVNPAVMTGAVATQVGYYTQLNSYDQAFQNTLSRMMLPKLSRNLSSAVNRYAISENTKLYFEGSNSVYLRPYTTFEKVDLKGGPDVSSIMYGTFVGTDSRIYELKNGKRGQLSGYMAYNGSRQTFDGNSINQNGGTLGITGSLYKGDFFTALTANAGASMVQASTMFGSDEFPMLMTGVASKSGYNIDFADGKFTIQPNFLMSYTFINTFDYTNSSGVKISSDPLHAIQIAPGVRFFANMRNGWQPYFTVSMRWNIMDKTDFRAANVALPGLSTRPYVEYGIGVQKTCYDNVNGFFQTVVRNGGRNGVALALGFEFLLGKRGKENL